jgi:hypothetical protein
LSERLLPRQWRLHDIDDVEAFCRRVLERAGSRLYADEAEDALAYLISECWVLSSAYDPERGASFATFAYRALSRRLVDRARSKYRTRWVFKDRVYERPRPDLLSLNALNPEHDRLGLAEPGGGVDNGACRLAAELRVLRARGRRPAGRNGGVGENAA